MEQFALPAYFSILGFSPDQLIHSLLKDLCNFAASRIYPKTFTSKPEPV
jgi:hypothetical protein